jgi:hypothetical protein
MELLVVQLSDPEKQFKAGASSLMRISTLSLAVDLVSSIIERQCYGIFGDVTLKNKIRRWVKNTACVQH